MNGYVIGLVILIVLVLAASAAASVIWDIDYKRQVSGKRQFRKLEEENAYRMICARDSRKIRRSFIWDRRSNRIWNCGRNRKRSFTFLLFNKSKELWERKRL